MDKNSPHLKADAMSLPLRQKIELGQVPFLFRQQSLVSLSKQTFRPGGLMLTQRAMEFCNFSPDSRILDAGCGYGMTLGYLLDRHGITGTGLDHSRHVLKKNPNKSQPQGLIQSRLPLVPLKPETMDGIFCECTLSLVQDQKTCLKEFHRVLMPNGKLILTDIYLRQFKSFSAKRQKNIPSCLEGAIPLIDMLKAVEGAGFQIDIIEDHTRLLNQMAGQMHNDYQSRESKPPKPGYCMIIAGKYDKKT